MSEYRTKLIYRIKRMFDKYISWKEYFEDDPVVSLTFGRVNGLVDALCMLDGKYYNIYDCLALYEELTK